MANFGDGAANNGFSCRSLNQWEEADACGGLPRAAGLPRARRLAP
jgi:hypothetical protein